MDLQMPEMDGFRATAEIRKYYSSSELPIMAMTADVQKETREKCLATGMNDYISKPIEPSFLYEKLIHQLRPDVEPELVTKTTDLGKQVFDIEKIPRLHGVNPKLSLINMDHNAELYRKILRRVFKDYHDRGKDIHQNLLMGDYKTAGQLTHTIKGVFGTLGAEQLYGVAGDLEQAIITADIERIAHLITIFTYNFEKFMYSLENFILQEQDSFTDTEGLENLATAPQF
jgi:polar amino acid transport system substrate-binding protein